MRSGVSPIPISNRRGWILTNLFENYLLKRLTKTTPRPPLRNRRTWFSRTFTTRSKSTDSCGEAVLTRTVQLRANMKHKVQNTRTTLLVRRTVAHLLVGGVSESLGVPCSSKHGGCWEKMLASKISILLLSHFFYWLISKGILNILLDVRCFSWIFFFFEHSTLLAETMQLVFFIKFQCFFVTAVRAISRYKF